MDTKRMVFAMLLAMTVMLVTPRIVTFIGTQLGYDMSKPAVVATTQPADAPPTTTPITPTTWPTTQGGAPQIGPTTGVVATQNAPTGLSASSADASTTLLGSTDYKDRNEWAMGLRISSRGAAVQSVTLNEFFVRAGSKDPYVFQTPYGERANTAPLATRGLTINGKTIDLAGVDWQKLPGADQTTASFSIDIADGGAPVARVVKTFKLAPRTADPNGPGGYEVLVTQSIQNLSTTPLSAQTTFAGPTTPPVELERGQDRQLVGGFEIGNSYVVRHQYVEYFSKPETADDFAKPTEEKETFSFTGVSSVYFNAIIRPLDAIGAARPAWVKAVPTHAYNPTAVAALREIEMKIESDVVTIPVAGAVSLPMEVLFGPKKRELLGNTYYTALGYNQTLLMTAGPCSYCVFQPVVDVLFFMLRTFHFVLRDWGLAIIALVCVVRTLLHPITKRSQISMLKMGKLGPEMEKLKQKYKDNPEELNKATMQFYKEQGFGPFLGCLPQFLQMPIWIALFSALQTTFDLRQAAFLHPWGIPLTWIKDLSQPDHLIEFAPAYHFNLFMIPVSGLNILPFLLGVVFFLQQKYTPKPPATTPEQEQQQKIMQWMPLLFPVFLYGGPSGLNLYILTSTTIGIIESKIIRRHIKEQEEREALDGPILVDAKPSRATKQAQSRVIDTKPAEKKKGIAGWLANIQEKAEQMAKEAEKKKKGESVKTIVDG